MLSITSRRFARFLTTPLFPRRRYSKIGNLCLPTEIILIIGSHLDDVSATCLALTCRFFFNICLPKELTLDAEKKQMLLLSLERDLGNLYYCHDCVKLHCWCSRWRGSISLWYNEQSPCERNHLLFLPTTHYIPYHFHG